MTLLPSKSACIHCCVLMATNDSARSRYVQERAIQGPWVSAYLHDSIAIAKYKLQRQREHPVTPVTNLSHWSGLSNTRHAIWRLLKLFISSVPSWPSICDYSTFGDEDWRVTQILSDVSTRTTSPANLCTQQMMFFKNKHFSNQTNGDQHIPLSPVSVQKS